MYTVGHREAFGVSEKEHVQIQSEVESVILDSVTNFNAVIKVKSQFNIAIKCCHHACYNFSCFCAQSTTEGGRLVDM